MGLRMRICKTQKGSCLLGTRDPPVSAPGTADLKEIATVNTQPQLMWF
jgi:hypothetical protein